MTKRVCNYRYPQVASVRLLFFVSIHSYYRDQTHIDCLLPCHVVTYDLVTIPASDYLTPNLGSPDTSTLWHTDRYPHSRTTINTPSFPEQSYIGMPSQPLIPLLPTLAQFSNAVCQVVYLSPLVSFCFHLLTKLIAFAHCTNPFHPLCISFIQLTPFTTCYTRIPSDVLLGGWDVWAERKKGYCIINAHVNDLFHFPSTPSPPPNLNWNYYGHSLMLAWS